jgi:hypothetical protein
VHTALELSELGEAMQIGHQTRVVDLHAEAPRPSDALDALASMVKTGLRADRREV